MNGMERNELLKMPSSCKKFASNWNRNKLCLAFFNFDLCITVNASKVINIHFETHLLLIWKTTL